jgi:hypothetical protein
MPRGHRARRALTRPPHASNIGSHTRRIPFGFGSQVRFGVGQCSSDS